MKHAYRIILGCWIILAIAGCRTTPPPKPVVTTPPPAKPAPPVVAPRVLVRPPPGLWARRSPTGDEAEYRLAISPDGVLSLSPLQTNVVIEDVRFDGQHLAWSEKVGDATEKLSAEFQPDGKSFLGSLQNGIGFSMTMIPEKPAPEPAQATRKAEASFERTSPLAGVWAKEWFVGGGYEYRFSVAPDGRLSLIPSLAGVTIEDLHFDGVKLTWTERAGGLTEQSTARLQPDGLTFVGLAWNAAQNTSNKFRMEKIANEVATSP